MGNTSSEPTGQRRTDASGSTYEHHIGAAGEHLVASLFLADGTAVYFPVAQAGWVDLVVQTPHGFKRVQVKTSVTGEDRVRVRGLGASDGLQPSDRYDILAVVHKHRVWLIPASILDGKDTITLHPQNLNCPYAGFRKR